MKNKLLLAAREFTGAFADIGTLLPLLIGLIACNGINAEWALVLVGLTYIMVGVYYRLPVPVQPMKALAMIAIVTGASIGEIRAATFWMAAILLILGVTRIADKLSDIFPKYLVHVLQLNLGIMLVHTGVKFFLSYPATVADVAPKAHSAAANVVTAGFFPTALDFRTALFLLVIPQLPLTLGNAMVATRDCALSYFGKKGERVTLSRLAITMSIADFASATFGGIPICHGAGGMTAHHRLGAKTGAACVIIGSTLLGFGILRGNLGAATLSAMPAYILGILLMYVGVRHALLTTESFKTFATAGALVLSTIGGWYSENLLIPLGIAFCTNMILLSLSRLRKHAESASG